MLVINSVHDAQPLLPHFAAVHPETNSPEAIRCFPRPSPPRRPPKPPLLPARWCSPAPLPAPLRGLEDRIAIALSNALFPGETSLRFTECPALWFQTPPPSGYPRTAWKSTKGHRLGQGSGTVCAVPQQSTTWSDPKSAVDAWHLVTTIISGRHPSGRLHP